MLILSTDRLNALAVNIDTARAEESAGVESRVVGSRDGGKIAGDANRGVIRRMVVDIDNVDTSFEFSGDCDVVFASHIFLIFICSALLPACLYYRRKGKKLQPKSETILRR